MRLDSLDGNQNWRTLGYDESVFVVGCGHTIHGAHRPTIGTQKLTDAGVPKSNDLADIGPSHWLCFPETSRFREDTANLSPL